MRSAIRALLSLVFVLSVASGAFADDGADDPDEGYASADSVEVGGSIGFSWTPSLFTLDVSPTAGWFVVDNFELSLILRFEYENEEIDGERETFKGGSALIEPSYHLELGDTLYGFVGLGVGPGYDGSHADFRLVPRVGLNIEFGRAGVLTPALRIPLLIGKKLGADNEDFGMVGGVAFELGVTTSF